MKSTIKEFLINKEVEGNVNIALEQYKTYLEMADRISSRRLTANSFFLTINTALVALTTYIEGTGSGTCSPQTYWVISVSGMVLCYMWYRLLRSYRDLNTAKFNVVHEIESCLPLKPYDAEWLAVGEGKDSKKYLPFTHIEVGVPWVFLVLHFMVLLSNIPWQTCINAIKT